MVLTCDRPARNSTARGATKRYDNDPRRFGANLSLSSGPPVDACAAHSQGDVCDVMISRGRTQREYGVATVQSMAL